MTEERAVQVVKFVMGGLAVIAAYLLASPDLDLDPVVKVALGAFLAFSAYANPASIVVKAGTARQMTQGDG